jgi:putative endonuclease
MYNTYYVYILSNKVDTVLYIGVTNIIPGFTQQYNCDKLVYFESYSDINQALDREKQLKKWRREKKEWLIKMQNPEFADLSEGFLDSLRSLEMTEERSVEIIDE